MIYTALPISLILTLPLAGVWAAGKIITPFLAFPPKPVFTDHAPFSLLVFILILAFTLAATLPLVKKGLAYTQKKPRGKGFPLPWWGKPAMAGLVIFWGLAWTRLNWFSFFQAHTFFPLWFSLILVINAMAVKRSGTCPLTDSPKKFLLLFPVSALFWWIFEYLNRFVGNWYYTGSQYPALTYFLLATLSFSTVLPAVESMKAYLMSFERISRGFKQTQLPIGKFAKKPAGIFLMIMGSLSLAFIGIFPDILFFTVWLAPFFIFLGHALVRGLSHPFEGLKKGDATQIIAYALAALCCGFFWELFNVYSLARWEYSIPYVQVLHIFEMPVLGYAGYLPFGLECAVIIHIIYNFDRLESNES